MIEVGVVLGYEELGAVRPIVRHLKVCGLTPFLVTNRSGSIYSDILPSSLTLRSAHANQDHQALAAEMTLRITEALGSRPWKVACILNLQDRMWPLYCFLARLHSTAASLHPDIVERTAIKANMRFLTAHTRAAVPYAVLTRQVVSRGPSAVRQALGPLLNHDSLILKPLVGMAGFGVVRVRTDDLPQIVRQGARLLGRQKRLHSAAIKVKLLAVGRQVVLRDSILVERYINGTEYSVEGITDTAGAIHSLIVQEKTKQEQFPVFRDLEFLAGPSPHLGAIRKCLTQMIKSVGYRGFPFHIELKIDSGGRVFPIEFNPRMGGGSIAELVSCIHGKDLFAEALQSIVPAASQKRFYVTSVIQPKVGQTGELARYVGLAKVSRDPSCIFVKKLVAEKTVITHQDREVYLVEICVVGSSREEARLSSDRLLAGVRAIIKPVAGAEPRRRL
jgi:hypothetical protein